MLGDDKVKKDFLESFLEKLEILSISKFIFDYRHPDYRHPVKFVNIYRHHLKKTQQIKTIIGVSIIFKHRHPDYLSSPFKQCIKLFNFWG